MGKHYFDKQTDIAWCPGCGNFGLRNIMMEAYAEMGLAKEDLVMVSGIGQAAKSPQYYDVSYFNGLHGRALPVAPGPYCGRSERGRRYLRRGGQPSCSRHTKKPQYHGNCA